MQPAVGTLESQLTWNIYEGWSASHRSFLQPSHIISHSRGWASVFSSISGSCMGCAMISGLQTADGSYHMALFLLLGKSVLWNERKGLEGIHLRHFGRLLQVMLPGKLEKGKQSISFHIWLLQPKFFSEFWANHRCKFFVKHLPWASYAQPPKILLIHFLRRVPCGNKRFVESILLSSLRSSLAMLRTTHWAVCNLFSICIRRRLPATMMRYKEKYPFVIITMSVIKLSLVLGS